MRGGSFPAYHEQRRSRMAPVFGLLRSWAAGIVVLALASLVFGGAVFERLASAGRLESLGWRMFLLHLPTAIGALLSAFAAARVHPEPFRSAPGQHLLATLGVPLGAQAFSLVRHWDAMVPEGIVLSTLAVAAGCLVAAVTDVIRDRS